MTVRPTIAAALIVLAACDFSILTTPASAAAVRGSRQAWPRSVQARVPDDNPWMRGEELRVGERRRKSRERLGLGVILGRWCDDQGQRWFFDEKVVIHDKHIHRASYERRAASIIVLVDGYPDRFSKFTMDGRHMTLLSSGLDPALKMRRFTRCPKLFSGSETRRVATGRT